MKKLNLKPLKIGKPLPVSKKTESKSKPKPLPKPVAKSKPKPIAKKKSLPKAVSKTKPVPPPKKNLPKALGASPIVVKLANLADKQGMWARDVIKYKAMLLKAGISPKDVSPGIAGLADRYNREQLQKLIHKYGANKRPYEGWRFL